MRPVFGHGDLTQLDIPVTPNFSQQICTGPQTRFGLSVGLPSARRLARQRHFMAIPPSMAASLDPVVEQPMVSCRGVPQVGQHVYATGLDLGGLRILILVDHVLVETLIHQLVHLGLLPGLAKGGEILPRITIQHQLVMDQLVSGPGRLLAAGELGFRQHRGRFGGGKNFIVKITRPGAFHV